MSSGIYALSFAVITRAPEITVYSTLYRRRRRERAIGKQKGCVRMENGDELPDLAAEGRSDRRTDLMLLACEQNLVLPFFLDFGLSYANAPLNGKMASLCARCGLGIQREPDHDRLPKLTLIRCSYHVFMVSSRLCDIASWPSLPVVTAIYSIEPLSVLKQRIISYNLCGSH